MIRQTVLVFVAGVLIVGTTGLLRAEEWILLSPKARGFNLLVWLLPGFAMLAGLVGTGWTIRRWLRRAGALPEASRDKDDPYVRRVREELKAFVEVPDGGSPGSGSMEVEVRRLASSGRPPGKRRLRVVVAWVGGSLAFTALLGILLMRSLEPRMEGMSITGGVGGGMAGMAMTPPSGGGADPAARLAAAHTDIDQQRFAQAIPVYQEVLARDPHNLEALVHLAIAEAATGQLDAALAALDRALAMDPNNLHALWSKAQALFQIKGDYAASVPLWERFIALAPDSPDAATARRHLEEARRKLGERQGAPERR